MAKSARSSNTKRNNKNLRTKIFGPAHDARTARLSAKLQELIAKPGPNEGKTMEVEKSTSQDESTSAPDKADGSPSPPRVCKAITDIWLGMDMDIEGTKTRSAKSNEDTSNFGRKKHRVIKKKPRNSIVFASERARSAKLAAKRSKR
jgi:hypothetical protein